MNQARNVHTASNLFITENGGSGPARLMYYRDKSHLGTELASPDHVIRLYYELYCHAVRTWKLWSLPLSWFVYEKNRLDLISPRVLKITVTHAVCTWRYWTLPLLRFERERIQLDYEFILLNTILRNRLFSEHMQWNYASFNVKSYRRTSISFNKIIKLPK